MLQDKLTRQGTSMSAPDTPVVQGVEALPGVPRGGRQRKRKEIEIVDERSERMQKRMVGARLGLSGS